jgi:hypothetical protein
MGPVQVEVDRPTQRALTAPEATARITLNDEKTRRPENQEGNSSTVTVTESEEITETTPEEPIKEAALSPEEEKVIRMLYGKSLKGQEALEFGVGASMETREKLALIEASLLEAFEAGALEPDPRTGAPRSVLTDKFGNE